MNRTYKDSSKIKEIIELILDTTMLWGRSTAREDLQNYLEAVAEVAFLQGQFSVNDEKLDLRFELDLIKTENQKLKKERQDYYNLTNGEEIENGIQKIKDSYNELQAFLGSPNRIK